ncbi:MAG: hypothetical protein KGJ90_00090 [Patescibacteria group bacterium]|nr:hypothetical protein [Patescibacteria group bacterium]
MRFGHKREFYIPKHAVKVADKSSDAVCYYATYWHIPSQKNRFHLVGFAGRAEKPTINYTIRNEKELESTIAKFFKSRRGHKELVGKLREERKAFVHNVKVGDIYRTNWGYDQTNVEFFEVIEIRGKFAVLRELQQAREGGGPEGYRCVPQSGLYVEPGAMNWVDSDYGKPIRRLIQQGRIKIDDVRTAWPWGKRVAGTIIGESAHATDTMFGH